MPTKPLPNFLRPALPIELSFLGAAGTVTGSRYVITVGKKNILVDCGLFQGLKRLRLKNWEPFPIEPDQIDAVVLTHAHLDHSGYLPRLIKDGFKGPIYATPATIALCKILLMDSGKLAEEEARYLNRHKKTRHQPALALYTQVEAQNTFEYFQPVHFESETALSEDISFSFSYAGHILGAASVLFKINDQTLFFTGDLGRSSNPILRPPSPPPKADFIVTESTYGLRLHSNESILKFLAREITSCVEKKGVTLIPAFAVGRAQEIIFYLWQLKLRNQIPNIPVYLDSPMASDASALLIEHLKDQKLSSTEAQEMFRSLRYVKDVQESKALHQSEESKVIISASGMLTGGRILHHIKHFGPKENTTILLAGYQAAGTRGEALEKGASEIKIHGEYVPIRAQVRSIPNLSAHADTNELIAWFKTNHPPPKKVFITHGEPSSSEALRLRLTDILGWKCHIPELGETVTLS